MLVNFIDLFREAPFCFTDFLYSFRISYWIDFLHFWRLRIYLLLCDDGFMEYTYLQICHVVYIKNVQFFKYQ